MGKDGNQTNLYFMDTLDLRKKSDYTRDYLTVASQLYYWVKDKPDNMELKAMASCLTDMHQYTQSLELEVQTAKKVITDIQMGVI